MIVGKPSRENIRDAKAFLSGFKHCSGLAINFNKSRILGLNVGSKFLKVGSDYLVCFICPFPFHFLGIQIGFNPRRRSAWFLVLVKVGNISS